MCIIMKTKEMILVAVVLLLLAVTVAQAYQINQIAEKAAVIATGGLQAGTELTSYDEMMAAHHGTDAVSGTGQSIGGC